MYIMYAVVRASGDDISPPAREDHFDGIAKGEVERKEGRKVEKERAETKRYSHRCACDSRNIISNLSSRFI